MENSIAQSRTLPDGPLIGWYGDDFTGAAAVMEVLTFAGLPSILFLDLPDEQLLEEYRDMRGIGIASTARAQTPEWMDKNLPDGFKMLDRIGVPLIHYKICTTLDSSPHTGSIGRAMDIAADTLGIEVVPVLVAAPQMRRYQFFGHLFAAMDDAVYRIDRHPVMSRHPVTPIAESDVMKHMSLQTDRFEFGLISTEDLHKDALPTAAIADDIRHQALVLDSYDVSSEAAAGRILWQQKHRFVVGSQGVEYALIRHWQNSGCLAEADANDGIGRAAGMAVVSGSVSEITAQQINWSKANGFACIAFDILSVIQSEEAINRAIESAVSQALSALEKGQDPLVYTAMGPDDPDVLRFRQAFENSTHDTGDVNRRLGESLGKVLLRIVTRASISRAVISGGDTSGFAAQQLGIYALTALAPTIPGAAIFRAHAKGSIDGLELALKGGQMGSTDYFGWVRDGGGQDRDRN